MSIPAVLPGPITPDTEVKLIEDVLAQLDTVIKALKAKYVPSTLAATVQPFCTTSLLEARKAIEDARRDAIVRAHDERRWR